MHLLTGSAISRLAYVSSRAYHEILSSAVFLSEVINNHEIVYSRQRVIKKVNIRMYVYQLFMYILYI